MKHTEKEVLKITGKVFKKELGNKPTPNKVTKDVIKNFKNSISKAVAGDVKVTHIKGTNKVRVYIEPIKEFRLSFNL